LRALDEEEDEDYDPNIDVFADRVLKRLGHEGDEAVERDAQEGCLWKGPMGVAPDDPYYINHIKMCLMNLAAFSPLVLTESLLRSNTASKSRIYDVLMNDSDVEG
jgi:hypothetical protein